MVLPSLVKIAFSSILANKLRSGLTLLGIVIGVTSVMTIISALEGMTQSIEQDLERLGPSTFVVARIGIATSEEEFLEKIKRKPIDHNAVNAIEEECDLVDKLSARAYNRANVKYKSSSLRNVLIGASSSSYLDIVDLQVAQGRFHSQQEDAHRSQVCFIGEEVRKTFFEGIDPLGKTIKIDGRKFTVIGVAKPLGSSFGQNRDNIVLMPLSSFSKLFGFPRHGLSIVVKAKSVELLPEAMDQVRGVLRAQRHVPYNKEDDFDLLTADSILEVLNNITRVMRFGLVGISSISVVVGGIVVMNIMMVSVTERTREIGIRKSIGAKQSHLLLQFLFESLILTLSGGIFGIVAGFIIARSLVKMIDMTIAPSTLAIVAGLSISIGIGVVFGIYPAMKAARLDPIKALSYE